VWFGAWLVLNAVLVGIVLVWTKGRWPIVEGGTEIFTRDLKVRIQGEEFTPFLKNEVQGENIPLGVSMISGNIFSLGRKAERLHVSVQGGSGFGKTTLLKVISEDACSRKYPVIVVDPKGSDFNTDDIRQSAIRSGVLKDRFFLFSLARPEESCFYNPLAAGSSAAKADRLMKALDWSETYYRNQASTYLSLLMPVLDFYKLGQTTLLDINEALCREKYISSVRVCFEKIASMGDVSQKVLEQVRELSKNTVKLEEFADKDLAGLKSQIMHLCQDGFGYLFAPPETKRNLNDVLKEISGKTSKKEDAIYDQQSVRAGKLNSLFLSMIEKRAPVHQNNQTMALEEVIRNGGFIYIQVPIMELADTGRQLVRLVMEDLKGLVSRIYHKEVPKPELCSILIDEFGQFADENFPVFLEQAREANCAIHMFYQSVANLQAVSPQFLSQVEDSTGVKIFMNTASPKGAEEAASLCGTVDSVEASQQTVGFGPFKIPTGLGNARPTKQMRVEHDVFKQLGVGQAVILERTPYRLDLVQIWNPEMRTKSIESETCFTTVTKLHRQLENLPRVNRAAACCGQFDPRAAWKL
jgi:hypothetical protein